AALVLPFGDQRDDGMRRRAVDLGRLRAGEAEDVARVLDDRDLHAEADPKVRHALLAREPHGLDLALDAALAEAAGHENRVGFHQAPGAFALDVLRLDVLDVHAR